jgi:hypothetical protein
MHRKDEEGKRKEKKEKKELKEDEMRNKNKEII